MANLADEVKKRLKDVKSSLDINLNPDDPALLEQLTLGEDWDNPQRLGKSLDLHSLWLSRWNYLLKKLKSARERAQTELDVWVSIKKEEIEKKLNDENLEAGMTVNQAKPTAAATNNRFNSECVNDNSDSENHIEYAEHKKKLDKINSEIDNVSVVVTAFENRTQMLIQMAGILRSIMDNKIYSPKKKN